MVASRALIARLTGTLACAAALGALATAQPAAAQVDHWELVRASGRVPVALRLSSSVYDPVDHRMLVFGGTDEDASYNDLWALSLTVGSESWTKLRPYGQLPYYRQHAAAALDDVDRRLVVFGGYNIDRDTYYDETWILDVETDGGTWSKLPRAPGGPPERQGATLVYQQVDKGPHPVRRMILFGGYNRDDQFADVWSFDPAPGQEAWTRIQPAGPSPRSRDGHVAIYDPVGNRMIVFGGWNRIRLITTLKEVWALDLTPGSEKWTDLTPSGTGPAAMAWSSAVYDPCPGEERMLLFGGYDEQRSFSDTWALSLEAATTPGWTKLDPTGARPKPRDSHVAVFDEKARRMVIHAGWDNFMNLMRDVWALNLTACAQLTPAHTPTAPASPTREPTPTSASMGTLPPSATSTSIPASPTATYGRPTRATPDCRDQYEPDNEWFQANLIDSGSQQQHSFHTGGDVDYVKFVAQPGNVYRLRTLNLAGGVDTRLYLYDTDGQTQLDWNDDDPANPPASLIEWRAPSNGSYFLKALNLDPSAGGCAFTYSLEVSRQGSSTAVPTGGPTRATGSQRAYLPLAMRFAAGVGGTATPDTPICDPGFERGRFGAGAYVVAREAPADGEAARRRLSALQPRPGAVRSAPGDLAALLGPEIDGPPGNVAPLTPAQAAKLDSSLRVVYERLRFAAGSGNQPSIFSEPGNRRPRDWDLPSAVPDRVHGETKLRVIVTGGDVATMQEQGLLVRAQIGDVVAALVPAEDLDDLARLPAVTAIQAPSLMRLRNDLGRASARVPEAVAKYGVTGRGVVVAVIDTGLDYSHQSFVDSRGQTRVRALLDLVDPGDQDVDGTLDGNGPGGGTLYTESDINRALQDEKSGRARVYECPGAAEAIPDQGTLERTVTVAQADSTTVSSAYLQLYMLHSELQTIDIELVAPDGTRRQVPAISNPADSTLVASYEIAGLVGADTSGDWTLSITDGAKDDRQGVLAWCRLHVNRPVRQEDRNGHGTHVTGTAAGDDAPEGSTALGTYAGMAAEADIVAVRADRQFAGFWDDDVIVALHWIDGFATGRGQPYVVNMSLGGHDGAHDGTAPIERAVDALVGSGKPGKVIVIANSNEGDEQIHCSGVFGPGADAVGLDIGQNVDSEIVDVWFEGPPDTRIGVEPPTGFGFTCLSYDANGADERSDCDRLGTAPGDARRLLKFSQGGEVAGWAVVDYAQYPYNGMYRVRLRLLGTSKYYVAAGRWDLRLHDAAGSWNAWSFNSEPFVSGDTRMTVGMPATAFNAIAVGAHTTRGTWTDHTGQARDGGMPVGQISPFSSRGPTRDGRTKPDLAAPGAWIASALSRDGAVEDWTILSSRHVVMPGTSMAAPHACGAVALLQSLAGGEALDALQIRGLLTASTQTDSFTGAQPDPNVWGAGKLDVYSSIEHWKSVGPPPSPTTGSTPSATPSATTTKVTTPATPPGPTVTIARPTATTTPPGPVPTQSPSGPCWVDGGALPRTVVQKLDDGQPAFAGAFSAQLGEPTLGIGLPGGRTIPAGSAWVEQSVTVPDSPTAELSFWYRIVTYDIAQDSMRRLWDVFAVYVDGEMVFSDGNFQGTVPGTRHEIGWQRHSLAMSRWRGRTVTLRFANWNGHDGAPGAESYNTWTYLDDVYLLR